MTYWAMVMAYFFIFQKSVGHKGNISKKNTGKRILITVLVLSSGD